MEEQGYKMEKNVIYQDNKSAILLKKNGRNSRTGNTRHINIRYFWIKDVAGQGNLDIEYVPTNMMLVDYFTKPLSGTQFRTLREYVMGWRPLNELTNAKGVPRIKEDVGIQRKNNHSNSQANSTYEPLAETQEQIQRVAKQNRKCASIKGVN